MCLERSEGLFLQVDVNVLGMGIGLASIWRLAVDEKELGDQATYHRRSYSP